MNPKVHQQLGMIKDVQLKFEIYDIQVPLGLELLIRGKFCVSCLLGLNLFKLELPE